jgi:hypothetical protein
MLRLKDEANRVEAFEVVFQGLLKPVSQPRVISDLDLALGYAGHNFPGILLDLREFSEGGDAGCCRAPGGR